VGHQAYTHKILTGRRKRFASLRQQGGLSGFTCREESEHDVFGAGHASTSISSALGMAIARDLSGNDYHVVAVIGDGAIAGGMAFEALNHAGLSGSRFTVVLNDNGMSISPTVGALAKFLGRVRFDHRYHQAKERSRQLLSVLPWGSNISRAGKQVKAGFKSMVMPTTIWEELGFTYLGPIDGHNLHELELALATARDYRFKPTLVHVVTVKGKGYPPAEGNSVYYHGLPAKTSSSKVIPTYSEIFAKTVLRLARENPRLVVITPAMPEGNCLSIIQDEFPQRVFDVGICEQHAVTFAAGLATQGYIPIVAIYSTFLQRAFDQIIHDVCIQNLPVIFAVDRSGIVGDDGKTHQGTFDLSYLTLIPNLIVSAPKDENELQHLLYTAVKSNRPMAVRYPRSPGSGVELDRELNSLPIGKGEILRHGDDVAIIAIGAMVAPALEACEELASNGIEATVVNARFAKPLDSNLIMELASRIKHIVTIEENTLRGGFGRGVIGLLNESGMSNIQVISLGLPDEFIEHGTQATLRSRYSLDARGITREILSSLPILAPKALLRVKDEARATKL
ncbi:MAG: 1-deoxy-D-xylulose-5-phosphate synthase, partial [Dehalococcoidales bacterium]|nr:1-deoxy-D-xylulose-5-phosphate synthase [Dehalococcoidales bacterium]